MLRPPPIIEVAVEEAGPRRSCSKGLRVEDLSEVRRVAVFCLMSSRN